MNTTRQKSNIDTPEAAPALAGRHVASGIVLPDQQKSSSRENSPNFRYCIKGNPRLCKHGAPRAHELFKLHRKLTKLFSSKRKAGAMFLILRVSSRLQGCDIPEHIQNFIDNYFFHDFHSFLLYWQRLYDKRKKCYAQDPKTKLFIASYDRLDEKQSERVFMAKINDYFSGMARRSLKTNEILTTFDVYKRYHPHAEETIGAKRSMKYKIAISTSGQILHFDSLENTFDAMRTLSEENMSFVFDAVNDTEEVFGETIEDKWEEGMIYFIHIKDGGSLKYGTYIELVEKSQKLQRMGVSHSTEIINDSDKSIKNILEHTKEE